MGASGHYISLQLFVVDVVSAIHGPSEPISPVHPAVYKYALHNPKVYAQPFPVVKQPERKLLQAELVLRVAPASVQFSVLQFVYPLVEAHFPSEPIIPEQPADAKYELHNYRLAVQPLPVVKQLEIHPEHCA